MLKDITDTKIAQTFKVSRDSLIRWKGDHSKYPHRYDMYKMTALLLENEIDFQEVLALADKNKTLVTEIEDMLEYVKGLTN